MTDRRTIVLEKIQGYKKPYRLAHEDLGEFLKQYASICERRDESEGIPVVLTMLGARRFAIEVEDEHYSPLEQIAVLQKLLDDEKYILTEEARGTLAKRIEELE